jgi:cytochrome c-type biogenesis protein CcmH/NrfF
MFLAHAGHWLVSVLYVIPVFAVLGAVFVISVRARRAPTELTEAELPEGTERRDGEVR